MTTNFSPENESTGAIALPKTSEIEAIYESIEQNAREQYKPQLLPKISPRLTMLVLATVGVVGALIGSADLKVDTTVTFDTKLGQRTQPHWLVPKGAKVVRTDTGAGAIKGLGWLLGSLSGAALWHVAGNDERWQRFVGTLQTQWVEDYFKRNRAMVELQSMAALQMEKQRLDKEVNVDLAEQTWQFHQAIGYDPLVAQAAQNTLPYGAPGTYDDVNNPGDKVTDSTSPAIQADPTMKLKLSKLPRLTNYPAVLIYGPQGSGKTFLAEEEIKERKQAGHKITALDPHAGFNSWRDCEVVGSGMDYATIDAELADFAAEVKSRYERIRKEPNPQFQPWTFVCDEFTNWASRCKASGEFFQAALSDIRKAKMYVIFVSHARTLAGLGDAKGMAATRDAALLEIELLGQIDPETSEAVPKFEALVKLPGQPLAGRKLVKLERKTAPTAPTTAPDSTDTAPTLTPSLNKAFSDSHQPHHPIPQGWKMANPADITLVVRDVIVACIRAGWSQTKTIQEVFGIAKSGNNPNYDLAREVFQQISNSIN